VKLYQYDVGGRRVVAAADGAEQFIVPGVETTLALLAEAGTSAAALTARVRAAGREPFSRDATRRLLIPLEPPEVWGFGVTYRKSASDREQDAPSGGDIYARAHAGPRPETFFKATASRCVGPGEAIGIRGDSALTAAEPELAYVVGLGGAVVAYTLGNDVSAWDTERDNPLYLPQSKIYAGCCALGPCLVTADEVRPEDVEITMTIRRDGGTAFQGRASTSLLRWPIAYLHDYLTRYNPVPAGTVAVTGTGIMTPAGFGLQEGDEVTIAAAPFGELVNTARLLK